MAQSAFICRNPGSYGAVHGIELILMNCVRYDGSVARSIRIQQGWVPQRRFRPSIMPLVGVLIRRQSNVILALDFWIS